MNTSNIKKYILIQTTFAASHCWNTIPLVHPAQFLRNEHRHLFHISIRIQVSGSDRELEFFEMKQKLDNWLQETFPTKFNEVCPSIGNLSCEMLAEKILIEFNCTAVRVMEDGENGAVVFA